ncbi:MULTISPECIES: hypothetical protein [unclassified Streptomyces]|uniref:hypothetical protein n=1 Tax=unclassified Streptomyces TaxID=2593676 RepID=UPI0037FD79EA
MGIPTRVRPPSSRARHRGTALCSAAVLFMAGLVTLASPAQAATPTAVYVANANNNTVSAVDTTTNTVTATIPAGSFPISIATPPL